MADSYLKRKPFSRIPNAQEIASQIKQLPDHWALTPVNGKDAYRDNWQHEEPLSDEFLKDILLTGELRTSKKGNKYRHFPSGVGLRTGTVSGGLVALDIDGFSASPLAKEIFGGNIPQTVGWTSGTPGKYQLLFQLPEEITNIKFTKFVLKEYNGIKCSDGQQLEIRYNECYSVLPPSYYPEKGKDYEPQSARYYSWINSPNNCDVALAPLELSKLIIELYENKKTFENAKEKEKREYNTDVNSPRYNTDVNSPWDIRYFAQYLEGYNPQGRKRGWITCKCPVHDGQSDDSLHINSSTGQYRCHNDCDTKEIYHAALAIAKVSGHEFPSISKKKGITLGELLYRCRKKIREQIKKCRWLPSQKDDETLQLEQPTTNYKVITFKKGERWKLVGELKEKGVKLTIDVTATGGGKSHDMGNVPLTKLDLIGAFYVTNDPRNPSCEALSASNEWGYLSGRNDGINQDEFGRIRLNKSGNKPDVEGNCSRVDTISLIRAYGVKKADNSELICQGCNNYELCRTGVKFGYLNARALALEIRENELKKLRSHPKSLPSAEPQLVKDQMREFPYELFAILFDEAQETFKTQTSLTVDLRDVEKTIVALAENPELLNSALPALTDLKKMLSGQTELPNKFGFSHHQLLEKITKCDVDLEALEEATKPDLSLLNTVGEYGEDIRDIPRHLRKRFNDSDSNTAQKLADNLLKQWAVTFFKILAGERGHFTVRYDKVSKSTQLILTYQDDHLVKIAQKAGLVYLADATANPEEFQTLLGLTAEEIAVIKEEADPITNLKTIQVGDLGRLGKDRGNDQIRRVDALIAYIKSQHLKTMCIRFDNYKQSGDHRHFVDSRGIQDGADADCLIIDGIPTPNLEALKADFVCIHGYVPTDETVEVKYPVLLNGVINHQGRFVEAPSDTVPYFKAKVSADPKFREFVRQRILAIIHQEIGRLRANRRPEEQLTVYILGEYPLDVPVTLVKAKDITPDAASKEELLFKSVQEAIATLQEQGRKATQQAIAELVGKTQQHISRLLKKLTHFAFDKNISKMCITDELCNSPEDPPPDVGRDTQNVEICQGLADNYLPAIAELPTEKLFEEVDLLTQLEDWREIWSRTRALVQQRILTKLFTLLPLQQLERVFC